MSKNPTLSIVIPVYNSASTLPKLVAQISNLCVEGGLELVLVNDGSRDRSAEVCRELAETSEVDITFVNLARNFGEHNAVLAGMRNARGDYIVTMDDDLQNPPHEVDKLFRYTREEGFDVVYSRCVQRRDAAWRRLGSWFTNRISAFVLDKPMHVHISSFRCMSRLVVDQVCRYDGAFPYLDGLILQTTQNVSEIEVSHAARQEGQSGYTLRKLLNLWTSMFVNFSVVPLRVSTGLGMAMGAAGLLGSVWVMVEHFVLENPAGWSSLMCGLFVFCGTQLMILGLLGEYVGRLYLNANRKPQSVIREVVRSH